MPISYHIDKSRRIVYTRSWGVVTDDDVLAHKDRLARDPDFDPEMGQLSDGRQVERLAITTAGVRAMVAHDEAHPERRRGHRLAFVVATDEAFGMARMYSQRSPDGEELIAVFRCPIEAEAWLVSATSSQ